MKKFGFALRDLFVMLASNTFAICMLAAVAVAAVLAFGFGAEAELIVLVLALGVVTALVETTIRARQK